MLGCFSIGKEVVIRGQFNFKLSLFSLFFFSFFHKCFLYSPVPVFTVLQPVFISPLDDKVMADHLMAHANLHYTEAKQT